MIVAEKWPYLTLDFNPMHAGQALRVARPQAHASALELR